MLVTAKDDDDVKFLAMFMNSGSRLQRAARWFHGLGSSDDVCACVKSFFDILQAGKKREYAGKYFQVISLIAGPVKPQSPDKPPRKSQPTPCAHLRNISISWEGTNRSRC